MHALIQVVQQAQVIHLSGKEQSKQDTIQEVRGRAERSYSPRYIGEGIEVPSGIK